MAFRAVRRCSWVLCAVAACAQGAGEGDDGGEGGTGGVAPGGGATASGGSGGVPGGTGGAGGVPVPMPMDEDAGQERDAALGDSGMPDAGPSGADPLTDVPFWIEALEADTRAVLWVKVDIDAGATLDLTLRYGDSSLSSESSIDDVFVFADDFSGAALDTAKWTIDDMTGWSVSGGQLHGGNTTGRIRSTAMFTSSTSPIVSETRFKVTTLPGNGFMANGFYESTSLGFGLLVNGDPANYYVRNNAAWLGPYSWTDSYVTNWARSVAWMKSGASALLTLARDADGTNLAMHPVAYSVVGDPLALGTRYDNVSTGEAYDAVWDFIFVRKWVVTEPTVTVQDDDAKNGACSTCYDKTVTIDNSGGGALSEFQVRIALDAMETTFWNHVDSAGVDVRLGTP